jgi:hypothetical protein
MRWRRIPSPASSTTWNTGEPGAAQAREYLLQVRAGQDCLRGNEMLAGETGQFGGGGHHQRPPRWPMLEVGHRIVGEIGPQHGAHCFRAEQAAGRDQGQQLVGGGGLAAAKRPIQPDDHLLML